MATDQRGNVVLRKLLAELGWSPSRLVLAVNGVLGPGYVGRSTVSEWLHQDRLPRHPLPTVVAHLISDTLDKDVSVDELWSGRAQRAELWVPADVGLHLPWTAAGTVEMLDDWLRNTGGSIRLDRRSFLAVSGAALTAPAWGYVDHLAGTLGGSVTALADAGHGITVTPAMVDTVAATTAGIRKLGNADGGHEDNLRFMHHHLTWVAKLLRRSRFTTDAVATRLLAEWAQLAQHAAWMAHDAGRHGLAQRYFTSGLHAAHTAGDRSVGAYLLAVTSQMAVYRGRLGDGIGQARAARDAVELANAAHEAARPTPAAVRAQAASAFAQAQAAVGNARGFHAADDEARALLDTPGALDNLPPYLAWFWPGNLEDCLAQGALTLAEVTSRDCRSLLDGANVALGRTAADGAGTPRHTLFQVAMLSRVYVAAGGLDRAVPAGLTALRQLPTVRFPPLHADPPPAGGRPRRTATHPPTGIGPVAPGPAARHPRRLTTHPRGHAGDRPPTIPISPSAAASPGTSRPCHAGAARAAQPGRHQDPAPPEARTGHPPAQHQPPAPPGPPPRPSHSDAAST